MSLSRLIVGRRQSALPSPVKTVRVLSMGEFRFNASYQRDFDVPSDVYYKKEVGTELFQDYDDIFYPHANVQRSSNVFDLFSPSPETKVASLDLTGLGNNVAAVLSDHFTDGNGLLYSFSDSIDVDTMIAEDVYVLNMFSQATKIRFECELFVPPYTVWRAVEEVNYGAKSGLIAAADLLANPNSRLDIQYWNGSAWASGGTHVFATGYNIPTVIVLYGAHELLPNSMGKQQVSVTS
jgi:hypothetical protein